MSNQWGCVSVWWKSTAQPQVKLLPLMAPYCTCLWSWTTYVSEKIKSIWEIECVFKMFEQKCIALDFFANQVLHEMWIACRWLLRVWDWLIKRKSKSKSGWQKFCRRAQTFASPSTTYWSGGKNLLSFGFKLNSLALQLFGKKGKP